MYLCILSRWYKNIFKYIQINLILYKLWITWTNFILFYIYTINKFTNNNVIDVYKCNIILRVLIVEFEVEIIKLTNYKFAFIMDIFYF